MGTWAYVVIGHEWLVGWAGTVWHWANSWGPWFLGLPLLWQIAIVLGLVVLVFWGSWNDPTYSPNPLYATLQRLLVAAAMPFLLWVMVLFVGIVFPGFFVYGIAFCALMMVGALAFLILFFEVPGRFLIGLF